MPPIGSGAATVAEHFAMKPALVAEAIGTALLVATVIGWGIMMERLSGDQAD